MNGVVVENKHSRSYQSFSPLNGITLFALLLLKNTQSICFVNVFTLRLCFVLANLLSDYAGNISAIFWVTLLIMIWMRWRSSILGYGRFLYFQIELHYLHYHCWRWSEPWFFLRNFLPLKVHLNLTNPISKSRLNISVMVGLVLLIVTQIGSARSE